MSATLTAVLSAYLLTSGTIGRREAEIFRRFRHIPREDVLRELENLWEEKKVQCFTVDNKHVWRATVALNV